MSSFDDVPLDKTEESDSPRQSASSGVWIVIGLVVLLVAGGIIGWLSLRQKKEPAEAKAVTRPVEAPADTKAPPPSEPLPALVESDAFTRELIRALSSHSKFLAWLATKDLIRTVTVVVTNVAEGNSPARHLGIFAPDEKFRAQNRRGRVFMDEKSCRRYDTLADMIESVDAEGIARAYERLRPLFVEAYRELGHPDGNFDAALAEAMRQVFETPVVEGEVPLTQPSVTFEFADRKLEDLTPGQKHLLRMGPRNVKIVQAKLREIALKLKAPVPRG